MRIDAIEFKWVSEAARVPEPGRECLRLLCVEGYEWTQACILLRLSPESLQRHSSEAWRAYSDYVERCLRARLANCEGLYSVMRGPRRSDPPPPLPHPLRGPAGPLALPIPSGHNRARWMDEEAKREVERRQRLERERQHETERSTRRLRRKRKPKKGKVR